MKVFLSLIGHPLLWNHVSLFADYMVVFLALNHTNLMVLQEIFSSFGNAAGLFTNLDTCIATLLNYSDEEIALVQNALSCKIDSLPCRYLGIPLSVHRLRKCEEQPLNGAVSNRITR